MRKTAITLLSLCLTATIQAQLYVNGHQAPFDYMTNSWLATIPESYFGQDQSLAITLDDGWQQMVIDGEQAAEKHTFQHITAESKYPATMLHTDGHSVSGYIQFTFLPVVRLQGDFGYDYQTGDVTFISPDTEADNTYSARLKWRGGTTNTDSKHKRNYNIKFDDDIKLFGMRSDNNWMLDAGQPDVFRMRNRIAMDVWNDMASKPYYADDEPKALNGVRGIMVELFLNDEYRGLYNLSEKLDRKQMKLKKAGREGDVHGVLYKGNSFGYTVMNDSIYEFDNYAPTLYEYEVKYPEPGDDNDSTDWKPLVDAINTNLILYYDDDAFRARIADWFDIPVMVDYAVFLSSVNALDNNGKNMYWANYDKAATHRMTPAPWDLDCSFGQRWGSRLTEGEPAKASPQYVTDVVMAVFFNLYRTNALNFNDRLRARYAELRQSGGVLATESLVSRFTRYYNLVKKSGAAAREEAKWSGDSDVWGDVIDFDTEYQYICDWIRQHLETVDTKGLPLVWNEEYFDATAVPQLTMDKASHHSRRVSDGFRTLSGQRVSATTPLSPGIYIINNKKAVIK